MTLFGMSQEVFPCRYSSYCHANLNIYNVRYAFWSNTGHHDKITTNSMVRRIGYLSEYAMNYGYRKTVLFESFGDDNKLYFLYLVIRKADLLNLVDSVLRP